MAGIWETIFKYFIFHPSREIEDTKLSSAQSHRSPEMQIQMQGKTGQCHL